MTFKTIMNPQYIKHLWPIAVFIFTVGTIWATFSGRLDYVEAVQSEHKTEIKTIRQAQQSADLERNTFKSDMKHIKASLDRVIMLLEGRSR